MFKNLSINRIWKGYYMPHLIWLFIGSNILTVIYHKEFANTMTILWYGELFFSMIITAVTIEVMQKYINNYFIFMLLSGLVASASYYIDGLIYNVKYLPHVLPEVFVTTAITSIFLKYKYNQEQKSLALQAKTDEKMSSPRIPTDNPSKK